MTRRLPYEVDGHKATITLNRPDALNALSPAMISELRAAYDEAENDDKIWLLIVTGTGRAFCTGADVAEIPADGMWKPVVCAVQGMCTAGAFYFVNESDVVICSDDATFFDSHVSAGLVCALEPIGLMRRVGLGETLRIALMGNDERVSSDTALRIGLVSEVVSPDRLWARAHEIAVAIAAKPPSATQGTVKAIWESLDKPYRAALEQNLIYTRLGNPLGQAELAARGNGTSAKPRVR